MFLLKDDIWSLLVTEAEHFQNKDFFFPLKQSLFSYVYLQLTAGNQVYVHSSSELE